MRACECVCVYAHYCEKSHKEPLLHAELCSLAWECSWVGSVSAFKILTEVSRSSQGGGDMLSRLSTDQSGQGPAAILGPINRLLLPQLPMIPPASKKVLTHGHSEAALKPIQQTASLFISW